jgi:hypothetical protein
MKVTCIQQLYGDCTVPTLHESIRKLKHVAKCILNVKANKIISLINNVSICLNNNTNST